MGTLDHRVDQRRARLGGTRLVAGDAARLVVRPHRCGPDDPSHTARRFLAAAVVVAGLVAWWGARVVKDIVQRSRPLRYIPDINVREGKGLGLGYLSGHSAVAAAVVVMAMAAVPRRWHPFLALIALLVGVARIVHGVHLAADVVGGWAFGTLIALAGLSVVDRWRLRHPPP